MLDGLELADGAAELHAYTRIRRRRVDAPLGDADRFGSEQYRSELSDAHGPDISQPTIGRDMDRHRVDPGDASRAIEARDLLRSRGISVDDGPTIADFAHDHISELSTQHRRAGRERNCRGCRPRRKARKKLVGGARAHRRLVQHRGRNGGRHVWAGRARASEFLDDNTLLDQREAGSASVFADVQAEPPGSDERVPERRRRVARSIEVGARHRWIDTRLDEAPDGLAQCVVLFGDADRHSDESSHELDGAVRLETRFG